MNENFRRRVFTPIVMPLTIVGAILLFAMSLSRVLLAVPESVSVLVAVLVAAYVLVMAFLVERNRNITAPALAVGLTIGFLGVVGAGAVAASVGVRDIHHGEEGEGAGAEEIVEITDDALVWETDSSLEFLSAPSEGPAGTVDIAITNSSGVIHNVTFEGFQGDSPLVEAVNGQDVTTVEVPAGTYVYYCGIPGHRAAGMEGEITFS